MKIDGLQEGESIFIDANIFIYNFGGESVDCKEVLLRCARSEVIGYTSTSILAEVLHRTMIAEAKEKGLIKSKNPLKQIKDNPEIIKQLSTSSYIVEKICEMKIHIVELTKKFIIESAKISRLEGLLTNDSILVTTMKDLGLKNLITNDSDFDHIEWLRIFKPSDL